jgi:hypothetical protein
MTKAQDLLDVWAERKIQDLQDIADMLDNYFLSDEYAKDCQKIDSSEIDWSEYKKNVIVLIGMDDDVPGTGPKRLRKAAIQRFKRTGKVLDILMFPRPDYDNCFDEGSALHCILDECKAIIEFLKHRSKADDMGIFFHTMDEMVTDVIKAMSYTAGRHDMKNEQREMRLGSGKGQQEAQARRITMLVDSLKEYDIDKDELRIKKNTFRGLVNKTFTNRENYPRHHSVYKTYQIESEKILSKKIIIT